MKLVIYWYDLTDETRIANVGVVEPTLERIAVARYLEQRGVLSYFIEERSQDRDDLNLDRLERQTILEALERSNFVQADAAVLLGVSSRGLNYKVRKHGIKHKNWKVNQ